MSISQIIIFSLFLSCVFAHTCLISPPQRGSLTDLNTAATADCFLTTGPCGGRPAQDPNIMLVRDSNFTLTWQKNENHWTTANPGTFNVSWADAANPTKFVPLYSFVDDNTPALTLYEYILSVDDIKAKAAIIQLQYIAPSLPATFYQCADIMIM